MAIVQTVFDFECRGYGWSEAWFKDSAQPTLRQFYVASAEPMANLRSKMLAAEASLTAVSTSFLLDKQDSYLRYVNLPGDTSVHCDTPHTTVYTILRADNDRKRKAVYIRGQDDNAVMFGGNFQPGAATFVNAGVAFFDTIVQNGWGWMYSVKGAAKQLLTVTPDAQTEQAVLTCAAGTFPVPPVGETVFGKVRINYKGLNTVLNGVHVVQIESATVARILKPLAFFPPDRVGSITVYSAPAFVAAVNWNFQKSGERRAGRPKLHTPGHRSARPRG